MISALKMGKLIIVPRIQQNVYFEEQQHRLAAFSSCLELHINWERKLGFSFKKWTTHFQKTTTISGTAIDIDHWCE